MGQDEGWICQPLLAGVLLFRFAFDEISLCHPGWSQIPKLKQSIHLRFLSIYDYRHVLPHPGLSVVLNDQVIIWGKHLELSLLLHAVQLEHTCVIGTVILKDLSAN